MGTLASNDTHGDVPIIPHAHSGNVTPLARKRPPYRLTREERELGRQWLWACREELKKHAAQAIS